MTPVTGREMPGARTWNDGGMRLSSQRVGRRLSVALGPAITALLLATSAVAAAEPPPGVGALYGRGGPVASPSGEVGAAPSTPSTAPSAPSEAAGAGALDPTFDVVGLALVDPTSGIDFASAVVVDDQERIVTAGGAGGNGGRFGLARLTSTGAVDPEFGTDGSVQTNFTSRTDYAEDLAVTPDGDLVAVGGTRLDLGDGDWALARYQADGTLDPDFGNGGKLTIDWGGLSDEALGVAVQPDGRIVVTGIVGANYKLGVVRLLADGSFDPTFNGTGRVRTNLPGVVDVGTDIVIGPTGRIIVAGETITVSSAGATTERLALAKYSSTGRLDQTFSDDGTFTDMSARPMAFATCVALLDGGKLAVAGARQGAFALARLWSNGTYDQTFSQAGRTGRNFGAADDVAWGLAVQGDGAFVLAGIAGGGDEGVGLVRLLADGGQDWDFVGGGVVITQPTTGDDGGTDVALQSDGRIVVAGYAAGASQIVVARYLAA